MLRETHHDQCGIASGRLCIITPEREGMMGLANSSAAGTMLTVDGVPTTRVLAIGRLTETGTQEARLPVMPFEVRATVRLHLAGKIDQWFFQTDGSGVVFHMNVTTVAEARSLLDELPLHKAGMMDFELIPLGPLRALGFLLIEPATA